jgi:methionyl-tRNA synthetase
MSKFYVCTSIPYVNAQPHIGFAMELTLADVMARYAKKHGADVIFSTGSDEHGGKIAEKAKEAGVSPKEFTDQISEHFRALSDLLNISNNRFIRTTDKNHEDRAKIIWKKLEKDIYKSSYIGWYCTGDEAFFTETEVKELNGVCPNHNRPFEKIEEENYFFKLSAYEEQVKKVIESGAFEIVPESKKNEILSLIRGGLDDISVSRPKDKISWGIPVPGDSEQVMYVWFEALMNYITVLGYPEAKDFEEYWPANVQVLGKDILRFHAAIWPAMLMSLGIDLPKRLYVHGFITIDDQKISKSLGNVVHPKDIVDKYGVDAFRYYFLRHIPSYDDGNFSWKRLEDAYNNELANELGNALQRTLTMVDKYLDGKIKHKPGSDHDMTRFAEAVAACKFDRALDEVWEHIRGINQFIDQEKPWAIAKDGDTEHLEEVLSHMVGSLLITADLLEPFLPSTSERMTELLSAPKLVAPEQTLFPKKYLQKDENEEV